MEDAPFFCLENKHVRTRVSCCVLPTHTPGTDGVCSCAHVQPGVSARLCNLALVRSPCLAARALLPGPPGTPNPRP
eukprot:2186609-Rhodomonas_salina.1